MTIKPLWSDDVLTAVLTALEEQCFWFHNEKGVLMIDRTELFRKFCPAIGIHNIPMEEDANGRRTLITVFISGNRVQPVGAPEIQDIIERLLEIYDAKNGSSIGDEVTVKLGLGDIFQEKGLRLVAKKKGVDFLKDTASTAHLFFKNGWLQVTEEGTTPLQPYSELPENKFIWNASIIRRDFLTRTSVIASLDKTLLERIDPDTGEYLTKRKTTVLHKKRKQLLEEEERTPMDTHFLDFLHNLSRDDSGEFNEKNFKNIQLAIGYLSHRHNQADQRKWVLIVDRDIDPRRGGTANGGNGKSVLVECLSNFLNTAFLDGREYVKGNSSNKFSFSSVTPSTDLVFIDDAAPDLDWKSLYSRTTGRFTVNKKHKDSYVISKEDAPKIVITSNYAIPETDSSTERRNFQVEVSSHYRKQREEYGFNIKDLHGQKLLFQEGGGWTDADYSAGYQVIADCIALYLREGLPTQLEESDTFKRNRLCSKFPVENPQDLLDHFLRVLNEAVEKNEEVLVEHFYKTTRHKFTFPADTSNRDLWEWLKDVGKAFRMNPNQSQNGKLKQARLVGERRQRWIDLGMNDWTDKNGNNPLEETDPKCYVFNVASLKNPSTIGSTPDFSKSSDAVTV